MSRATGPTPHVLIEWQQFNICYTLDTRIVIFTLKRRKNKSYHKSNAVRVCLCVDPNEPLQHAMCSAVVPSFIRTSTARPCAQRSNHSHTCLWPLRAAQCSAVRPSRFCVASCGRTCTLRGQRLWHVSGPPIMRNSWIPSMQV